MSQAIDLTVHLSEESVQSVNSRPEKQMDAMPIKNTNSAIIARSALQSIVVGDTSEVRERMLKAYRITTLLATKKKASLNSG